MDGWKTSSPFLVGQTAYFQGFPLAARFMSQGAIFKISPGETPPVQSELPITH